MSKLEIKSPLPGVFFRRPTPESAPYKNEGDSVAADEVIGLVEVMKSFHEIRAGITGGKIRFLIDNEDAVMAGDVIAEVEV